MLTRLGLRNFKAFGDEMQYAELAPITLIYGPNSVGKSSIIQALMLLKQSHDARSSENEAPFELVPQTEDADGLDLGSYQSIFHQFHKQKDNDDSELEIKITTATRREEKIGFHDVTSTVLLAFESTQKGTLKRLEYSRSQSGKVGYTDREVKDRGPQPGGYCKSGGNGITYHIAETKKDYCLVLTRRSRVEFSLNKQGLNEYSEFIKEMKPVDFVEFRRRLTAREFLGSRAVAGREFQSVIRTDDEELIRRDIGGLQHRKNNLNKVGTIIYRSGLPMNLSFPRERRAGTTDSLNRDLDIGFAPDAYLDTVRKLSYIGSLRQQPARAYPLAGRPSGNTHQDEVGKSGQNTLYLLYKNPKAVKETNRWLKRLNIQYEVEGGIREYTGPQGTRSISLLLKDDAGTRLGLPDVGLGVNQILPVIVEGAVANDRIICVEQPEIHLHPKLQAEFADFLIETSSAGKENKNNQWIVETHSEMVARKLLVRIREHEISNEDVSVLYVNPQGDGSSTIQQLRINSEGYWRDDWPRGFFDESANLRRDFRNVR